MKKLIILFAFVLPSFLFADELKIDSCYTIECAVETIDTIQTNIQTTKSIVSLTHKKSKTKRTDKEILKSQALAACWICDVVDDLSDAIVNIFTGVSFIQNQINLLNQSQGPY